MERLHWLSFSLSLLPFFLPFLILLAYLVSM